MKFLISPAEARKRSVKIGYELEVIKSSVVLVNKM